MKHKVIELSEYEDGEEVPVVLASHLGGIYRIGPRYITITWAAPS
jgi:hypothetical protein